VTILIITIVALSVAVGLAYQVHLDPGFALLTYGQTSIETSLAVLLFLTFIAFIIFYFILRAILRVKATPKNLSGWNSRRKNNRAQQETIKGLLESAEGNWQRSEKLLTKHVADSATPLLNYLSAAHAAQSQGAYDRRDDYLFKAGEALPEQTHAIHLTRAKLQLAAGQLEQTIASLRQLFNITPDNPIVLTLLLKTYAQLQDWPSLYKLLPLVRKNRHIDPAIWQDIEQQTLIQLLSKHGHNLDKDIDVIWSQLSKQQKIEPQYLSIYAQYKVAIGDDKQLIKPLEKALSEGIDTDLLNLYQQLDYDQQAKIKQLEKWLKTNPANIVLLNGIGSQYLQQKIYGKAQEYLLKSIKLTPSAEAYLLLGTLSERQNETPEKAVDYYRQGLELSLKPLKTGISPIGTEN